MTKIPSRLAFRAAPHFIIGLMLIGAVAVTGASTPAAAQDGIVKERVDAMKRLGGAARNFRSLSSAADGVGPAETILATTNQLASMWPEGSTGGESRAKPEIWQNMGDFTAKLDALKGAAQGVLMAAKSGDLAATQEATKMVGAACGGCHRVYRLPKDE